MKKIKIQHIIVNTLLLLVIGCSSKQYIDLGSANSNIYISNGVEKYFLTNLPAWANFSMAAGCFRKTPIRYLNFLNMSKSYSLSYEKMIHMQHMLNRKLYAYKTSTGQNVLSPRDEAYIFNNVYQQALGGSYDFRAPKFKKISIVWIDPYLESPKKLKQILRNPEVLEGYPILLSHCLSAYELEELSQELKLDDLGVKYLSAEMLTTYSINSKQKAYFSVNISKMLEGKQITFFSKFKSNEIEGDFKFVKLNN